MLRESPTICASLVHLKAYVLNFFKTPVKKVKIFKIVGASPLQSQVIRKSCRQNRWFSGTFWEKMLSHGQTVHFRPHSVIHHQKAEHHSIPKFRLKVNFRHPMKRQNFGDTSGQDPNLHLALCRKKYWMLIHIAHRLNCTHCRGFWRKIENLLPPSSNSAGPHFSPRAPSQEPC